MTAGERPSRRTVSFADARRHARRRLPRLAFDFIDGGAGRETSVHANAEALDAIRLQQRVLNDVTDRSLGTKLLGQDFDLPFGIAPMGMCNLAWPGADQVMAKEVVRRNIPVCISTAASTSLEKIREIAGKNAWFQLYVHGSAGMAMRLVERVRVAGYRTILITVDAPALSRRTREVRNGFRMPFRLGFRHFADFALHPHWSIRTLLSGIPQTRNFGVKNKLESFDRHGKRTPADWDFLGKLRDAWRGNLVVKGVLSGEDASRMKSMGIDSVYVSNHGGRQLDAAIPAIHALPRVRDAVGPEFPILFDSGIRSGEDVIRALALGADFVFLGRAILYAIGADGARGLSSLVDGLGEEAECALAQLGLQNVSDVGAEVLESSEFPLPSGGNP